jgi:hypothetical protein
MTHNDAVFLRDVLCARANTGLLSKCDMVRHASWSRVEKSESPISVPCVSTAGTELPQPDMATGRCLKGKAFANVCILPTFLDFNQKKSKILAEAGKGGFAFICFTATSPFCPRRRFFMTTKPQGASTTYSDSLLNRFIRDCLSLPQPIACRFLN